MTTPAQAQTWRGDWNTKAPFPTADTLPLHCSEKLYPLECPEILFLWGDGSWGQA